MRIFQTSQGVGGLPSIHSDITTTTGWTAMKSGTDIHGSLRIYPPFIYQTPADHNLHLPSKKPKYLEIRDSVHYFGL